MHEDTLIKNLQNPALYDHEVSYFKLIETHISWVILTGQYAYKIKKPFDFQFLDFSKLEKRKLFCEEEIRLNKFLAPEVYLEVLPITHSAESPQIKGSGEVIEYALKMREFPQENLFSELASKNKLTKTDMQNLARLVADFHLQTSTASPAALGTPEQVHEPVLQNFEQIRPFLSENNDIAQLERLEQWSKTQYQHWHSVLKQRKDQGFIRECHGDLHLGNIVLLNGKPVVFDCIEFNEAFRWTDVMADIGFLIMDLHRYKLYAFANVVLNTYLQETGDYAGLQILPYYQAYRAIVRAKISLFSIGPNADEARKAAQYEQYRQFMTLAETYTQSLSPFLLITHGISGSGKSTVSKIVAENHQAVVLRSDIERKRLAGLKATESSQSKFMQGIYTEDATENTVAHLQALAKICVEAGYPVIVDATFLKAQHRQVFAKLAQQLQVPFYIVRCEINTEVALARLKQQRENVSEAGRYPSEVIQMQQASLEPLGADELDLTISLDMSNENAASTIVDKFNKRKKS